MLLLSACATSPPVVQPVIQPAHPEQSSFVIAGRIAIKHQAERSSATVRWKHSFETDEILLFAPLGKVMARINRDQHGLVLDTPDKHYAAQDAEELTQQALGWQLPLSGLNYWVLALPKPNSLFDVERDANGQITLLRQDGWTIGYSRYQTLAPDSLPLRLNMQRDDLEIKLLIDEWEMP